MRFAIPCIWREPLNHYTGCYFCMVDPTKRIKGKNAPPSGYSNIPSFIAPVPHNTTDLPVPQPLTRNQIYSAETSSEDSKKEEGAPSSCAIRKRHRGFSTFFSFREAFCYCHDIRVSGFFEAIGIPCNTSDWRLFIDSSSKSLKAVLLHNTNKCPSILLAHLVQMKENYENVKMLLSALRYDQYNWEVIGDFNLVAFLMGLLQGFTKFPCYLCLWDSRNTNFH